MMLEPGGICILQSFKHCLTGEKTTINLAICAKMIKSASTDIDYAKLADFFNFLLLVFIMTLGAI